MELRNEIKKLKENQKGKVESLIQTYVEKTKANLADNNNFSLNSSSGASFATAKGSLGDGARKAADIITKSANMRASQDSVESVYEQLNLQKLYLHDVTINRHISPSPTTDANSDPTPNSAITDNSTDTNTKLVEALQEEIDRSTAVFIEELGQTESQLKQVVKTKLDAEVKLSKEPATVVIPSDTTKSATTTATLFQNNKNAMHETEPEKVKGKDKKAVVQESKEVLVVSRVDADASPQGDDKSAVKRIRIGPIFAFSNATDSWVEAEMAVDEENVLTLWDPVKTMKNEKDAVHCALALDLAAQVVDFFF